MARNPFATALPSLAENGTTSRSMNGDSAGSLFRPSKLSNVVGTMWQTTKSLGEQTEKKLIPSIFDKVEKQPSDAPTDVKVSTNKPSTVFVFGSKIKERVEEATPSPLAARPAAGFGALAKQSSVDHDSATGDAKPDAEPSTSKDRMMKSAANLEQSRCVVVNSDVDHPVSTGEEGEVQLCQIQCKLHQLVDDAWQGRGTGNMHVNHGQQHTRIVMRRSVTLSLVLNAKVYCGMLWVRASQKCIKMSTIESSSKAVHVYLITTTESSADELHRCVKGRLDLLDGATDDGRPAPNTAETSKCDRQLKRPADNGSEESPKKVKAD